MNPYILDVMRSNRLNSGNISLLRSCIFVHIPKCAGNTIKDCVGGFGQDSHSKAKEIPKDFFDNFYSFSFVRNPWDRCLSAYYYLFKGGARNSQDFIDREEFVINYPNFYDFLIKGGLDRAASNQTHFIPQVRFLEHRSFNFIGKVENIKKDMEIVCKNLKIECDLPHFNRSIRPSPSSYTPKMADVISRVYQEDIEEFGFSYK
jgi:hypothetical protein